MPSNLSAMGGNGAVTLTWDAPADDGGSAITGYRIEGSADGAAPWDVLVADTMDAARTYTQTGLLPGETRHYQVSAITTAGTGAPSKVASATTTRPLGPPRNLRATGGDGEATLTWAAPTDDGGSAITRYEYRYAPGETIPAGTEVDSRRAGPAGHRDRAEEPPALPLRGARGERLGRRRTRGGARDGGPARPGGSGVALAVRADGCDTRDGRGGRAAAGVAGARTPI